MSSRISLGQLVREVANSDATNNDAQRDLLGKLYEIKTSARDLRNPELEFLLDAAADLLRYLADGAQPSLQAMLTMVTRMIVNAECLMYRGLEVVDEPHAQPLDEAEGHAPTAPQPPAEPKAPATDGGLKLNGASQRGVKPALPATPQWAANLPGTAKGASLRIDPSVPTVPSTKKLNGMRIGQVLVELGLIGETQIKQALELQQEKGIRLGEALMKLGFVMPEGLTEALALQKKMREYAPQNEPYDAAKVGVGEWQESLLGALLVQRKAVTEEQLKKALSISRATGTRLGEALVNHGFCDWATVRKVIHDQERMRHHSGGGNSIPFQPGGGTW